MMKQSCTPLPRAFMVPMVPMVPLILMALMVLLVVPGYTQAQVLANDDFEDGDVSGWVTFVSGWSESGGVFRSGNVGANIPVEALYAGGFSWTNYTAEVDLRTSSSRRTSDLQLHVRNKGVATTSVDSAYGSCSLFRNNLNQTFLVASVSGPTLEQQIVPFVWLANTTYRLRAAAIGQTLVCEVAGAVGATATVTSAALPPAGTVGLRATHIPGEFDNLVVRATATAPEPPGQPTVQVGNRSIALQWQEPSETVDSYLVHVVEADSGAVIGDISVAALPCLFCDSTEVVPTSIDLLDTFPVGPRTVAPIENGEIYRLSVSAVRDGLLSEPSPSVLARPGFPARLEPRNPILFLHGFLGSASTFSRTATFLRSIGWRDGGSLIHTTSGVIAIGPTLPDATLDPEGDFFLASFSDSLISLAEQGQEVSDFINTLREQGVAEPLTVVAHSNGGLALRSYLTSVDQGETEIGHVVTYGTPHRGADVQGFTELIELIVSRIIPGASLTEAVLLSGLSDVAGFLVSQPAALDASFACGPSGLELSPFLESIDVPLPDGPMYTSIVGHLPLIHRTEDCHSAHWDGLVPTSSADLGQAGLVRRDRIRTLYTSKFHAFRQGGDYPGILCGIDENCMEVRVFSPVRVEVQAPDGRVLAHDRAEIPAAELFVVENEAEHPVMIARVPGPLPGTYRLALTPKDDALPTDTFSIEIVRGQHREMLVSNVPVDEIPTDGYAIEVPMPIATDVKPGSCRNPVNLQSRGKIPVAILGTADFTVSDLDPETILLEGVDAAMWTEELLREEGPCGNSDQHLDLVLKFDTQLLREAIEARIGRPVRRNEEFVVRLTARLRGGGIVEGTDILTHVGR